MKPAIVLVCLSCLVLIVSPARAQHCAPITESYLSQISIKHDAEDRAIDLKVEYAKTGGRLVPKYQVYVLAYLEKNEHRVPAPPPADLIDKRFVRVLHTQVVEANQEETYRFDVRLDMNDLAKKMIELGRFTDKDRESPGGWGSFKDRFRLAIFIPFLEDSTYSTLDGLPEDRHECNYDRRRALLFQPLPYAFSIHFGIVLGRDLGPGEYSIEIDSTTPTAEDQ